MSCENADSVITAIATAAAGPAEVESDAGRVKQFPLAELIKTHQYLASQCSAERKTRGLRFNVFVPGSAQ